METLTHLLIATVATLLPITNPLGNAAIFLSITEGEKVDTRHRQAFKGCVYMFVILATFFLCGSFILKFFGLSLDGIRIAGGLVITRIGFSLLNPQREQTHSDDEHAEAREKEDISFSPLAMPLLAGPGAIASMIGMISLMPAHEPRYYGAVIGGLTIVCVTCWVVLRSSERLLGYLGVNGASALTRIMGFLLLCIGVQLVIDGYIGITAPPAS